MLKEYFLVRLMDNIFFRLKKKRIFASLFTLLFISLTFCFPDNTSAQSSSTAYRLVGTVQGAAFMGAVFVDPAGVQRIFRIHDKLPDGSRIIRVQSDSIVLKRPDGTTFELFTAHDTKAAAGNPLPTRDAPAALPEDGPSDGSRGTAAPDLPPTHGTPHEPPEIDIHEAQPGTAVPDEPAADRVPVGRPEEAVPEAEPQNSPPTTSIPREQQGSDHHNHTQEHDSHEE
jgi:hypothetical protein